MNVETQELLVHPAGAARARARTRLYIASLLLGVMRAACDFSREYAKERQAFGKPIGHHQALAFLITDMQMALDGARLLVRHAAWRLDHDLPSESQAASALAECIDASRLIGPNSVQILGGHGFMSDYPVEKYMREGRALGLLFGGFDAAIEESSRHLCQSDAPLAIGLEGTV
jgi:alkylation response protein AidB-like acyl-CoA dehydrogenase